ncbi:MAG TPA: hypothetical protein VIP46_22160 [Pyrinomonadaceae bacterium]
MPRPDRRDAAGPRPDVALTRSDAAFKGWATRWAKAERIARLESLIRTNRIVCRDARRELASLRGGRAR